MVHTDQNTFIRANFSVYTNALGPPLRRPALNALQKVESVDIPSGQIRRTSLDVPSQVANMMKERAIVDVNPNLLYNPLVCDLTTHEGHHCTLSCCLLPILARYTSSLSRERSEVPKASTFASKGVFAILGDSAGLAMGTYCDTKKYTIAKVSRNVLEKRWRLVEIACRR